MTASVLLDRRASRSPRCRDIRPAVFVSKDGTIVRDVPFNVDARRISFVPGAIEGLRTFTLAGFLPIVVTNQPGIARGLFTEHQLHAYLDVLVEMLTAEGVAVGGVEYCPHELGAAIPRYRRTCSCRKPNPSMLVRAASRLHVDLGASWMIGDTLIDVEAGRRAGCRTALVGSEGAEPPPGVFVPDVTVAGIDEVARFALTQRHRRTALGA